MSEPTQPHAEPQDGELKPHGDELESALKPETDHGANSQTHSAVETGTKNKE